MKLLKIIRKSRNLTQEQVSNGANINISTYKQYETNRTEPNIETLIKIADYFDVSLDYLCGRQNKNLIFADSLTNTQKKLIEIIKQLTNDQANFALGYFSDMLKLPYEQVSPARPF